MHEPRTGLTDEDEAALVACRERWRALGLSTAPVDNGDVRRAVRLLYASGSKPEPAAVVTLPSPAACLIAHELLAGMPRERAEEGQRALAARFGPWFGQSLHRQLGTQLGVELGARLKIPFRDRLRARMGMQPLGRDIWERFGRPVGARLGAELGDQTWFTFGNELLAALGEKLWNRLWRDLRDLLAAQIWTQLKDRIALDLRIQLGESTFQRTDFAGQMDAVWLAYYDFAEQIGIKLQPRARARHHAYKAYAQSAGWMYAYEAIAFVSDRPAEIHFDARGRLHNAIGMAVRFRDGYGFHAWHGMRIPPHLIAERHKITPERIEAEPNAELRRVALEIFGFDKYLAAREAKVIAADEVHGQPRRLLEVGVAGTPVRIVEVMNGSLEADGTRRRFHLGAMPGATPHEAIAASYGIAPAHYREVVRA